MRDHRFIAAHRGGPLRLADHRLLTVWAADCAQRVLALVEASGENHEPASLALEIAREWARGKIPVGTAQRAALAAHAAAREMVDNAATAGTRAAGHAVATAHMADHSLRAASYALKAIAASSGEVPSEQVWQLTQLPKHLCPLAAS